MAVQRDRVAVAVAQLRRQAEQTGVTDRARYE